MTIIGDVYEPKLYNFAARVVRDAGACDVLDLASNDGRGTILIARMNSGTQVTAADLNEEAIAEGRKKQAAPNLHFFVEDARKTHFADRSFDAIVSLHTIEHLSDADQEIFMGELKRLIKPGGTLLIATPDVDVWALQGMAGLQKDHIKELTQKEFIDIVSRNGFVVEGVYGQRIAKQGVNTFRKILNFIKKLDIFHLRNIVRGFVDKVDTATQPVSLDYEVRPIKAGTEKASVTVLVCRS